MSDREDLKTSHEEADVTIAQQVVAAAKNGSTCIMLLHCKLTCMVLMEGTSSKRNVTDISASAKKHAIIVFQLLAAHALAGCDTVAYIFGVGKATVLKSFLAGKTLDKLGDTVAIVEEVIEEATKVVGDCYGSKTQESISKVRYHIWANGTSCKKITKNTQAQVTASDIRIIG